jgi:hypothetical protein
MFQKFHSPNQLKYLTGDFSKVSTHSKQQLLLKTFFYKFKNWTELSCCIWLVFPVFLLPTFFRMFQKFPSPNQYKYLMGNFSNVSSHRKQQFLLIMFFYKLKIWAEPYCGNG